MEEKRERWFSAVASNDLATIDQMLEEKLDANLLDAEGETALQAVAKKLYVAILHLEWEDEKLLKEIAATLVLHGANQEDLGHRGGETCDIARAITTHIIKTAASKGELAPINTLIERGDIWFPEENAAAKEQFLKAVQDRDMASIERMFEEELIGFSPTQ